MTGHVGEGMALRETEVSIAGLFGGVRVVLGLGLSERDGFVDGFGAPEGDALLISRGSIPSANRQRLGPVPFGQQLPQSDGTIRAEHHLGVEVGRVDLTDELSTTPARRQHVEQPTVVVPHRSDTSDPILAGGHHGGDRCVLGAETGTGPRVDAHPDVPLTIDRLERGGDIAEQPVAYAMRAQHGFGGVDEVEAHQVRIGRKRPTTRPAARLLTGLSSGRGGQPPPPPADAGVRGRSPTRGPGGCHAEGVLTHGEYRDDMTLVDDNGGRWRRVRDWVEPSEAEQLVADGMPYLVERCGTEEPRHERRERFQSDVLRAMVTRRKAEKYWRRRSSPTVMVGELWHDGHDGSCLIFIEQGPLPRRF